MNRIDMNCQPGGLPEWGVGSDFAYRVNYPASDESLLNRSRPVALQNPIRVIPRHIGLPVWCFIDTYAN